MELRKGDTVKVLAGKDKGVKGKVIRTYPERDRVLVEGVNRITKHTKVTTTSRGAQSGGLVHEEAPIHVSNVQLIDPESGKPTRIGSRRDQVHKTRADGTSYEAERSVRVARRSGKDV